MGQMMVKGQNWAIVPQVLTDGLLRLLWIKQRLIIGRVGPTGRSLAGRFFVRVFIISDGVKVGRG